MRMSILAFAAGVWVLQQQAALPGWNVLAGLAAVSAGLTFAVLKLRFGGRRALAVMAAALAGFAWAAALGQARLADALPEANEGRDIRVTGVVAGLPQAYENGVRFDFAVESSDAAVPSRISLAWYRGWRLEESDEWHALQELHAGERWQLVVRLKRPHGNLNPQGFDYEAWLFERGIRATGYVRAADDNRRLAAFVARPGLAVERLREMIRERFLHSLPEHDYAGVLVALAVGDQRAIDGGLWQLFARTGIS
ncbi:MAG: DUF4131 domain-containing protein, partial [Rhodocyclaceae bacterium]|nr:DUF4131 domain-containing protein [Rhodocyclaceae bacterium]